MRIVLTGGGTGGHFYPLIAVAEAIEDITKERTLFEPELIYIGPEPFDKMGLLEHDIRYLPSPAAKMRRYSSILNVFGIFKTIVGVIKSIFQLYRIYPDVVFSTGGDAAFPPPFAARPLSFPFFFFFFHPNP